jgi:hypothetical protein
MGVEHLLMQHLYHVFTALERVDEKGIETLAANAEATPTHLNKSYTPNQKLLQAACSYVDANLLPTQSNPNISRSQAQALAAEVFTSQLQSGHGVVGPVPREDEPEDAGAQPEGAGPGASPKNVETLTSSHAELWHAGAASLLAASLRVSDFPTWNLAVQWWRAEAALCHLTAWENIWDYGPKEQGHYQVIAPGSRGGSSSEPSKGEDPARDLDYEILLTGQLTFSRSALLDKTFLAPWLLSGLSEPALDFLRKPGTGQALSGPNGKQGPWTVNDVPLLPWALYVKRRENQHAAWFERLKALDPQLQAGVSGEQAWYSFWDSPTLQFSIPQGVPDANYQSSPFSTPPRPEAPVQAFGRPADGLSASAAGTDKIGGR